MPLYGDGIFSGKDSSTHSIYLFYDTATHSQLVRYVHCIQSLQVPPQHNSSIFLQFWVAAVFLDLKSFFISLIVLCHVRMCMHIFSVSHEHILKTFT